MVINNIYCKILDNNHYFFPIFFIPFAVGYQIRSLGNLLFIWLINIFIKNFKSFEVNQQEANFMIYAIDFFQFIFNVSYYNDYNYSIIIALLLLVSLYQEKHTKTTVFMHFNEVNQILKLIISYLVTDVFVQNNLLCVFIQNWIYGLIYVEMNEKFFYQSMKGKDYKVCFYILLFITYIFVFIILSRY